MKIPMRRIKFLLHPALLTGISFLSCTKGESYIAGNDPFYNGAKPGTEIVVINQARNAQQGLGTYTPEDFPELAIEHGHRYNFFCAPDMYSNQDIAPGTILPPGYFFTRVAVLHLKEHGTANSDVIKTVTPGNSGDPALALLYAYWGVWKWMLEFLPVT
jgi:hypothetical protein